MQRVNNKKGYSLGCSLNFGTRVISRYGCTTFYTPIRATDSRHFGGGFVGDGHGEGCGHGLGEGGAFGGEEGTGGGFSFGDWSGQGNGWSSGAGSGENNDLRARAELVEVGGLLND